MGSSLRTTDYPLNIHFRKFKRLRWVRHVPIWELSDTCATESIEQPDDSTDIVIYVPFPGHCPYDILRASIMLLNHEFLHVILEDVLNSDLGDYASDCIDDPYILKLLSDHLPDCYCFYCEDDEPKDKTG